MVAINYLTREQGENLVWAYSSGNSLVFLNNPPRFSRETYTSQLDPKREPLQSRFTDSIAPAIAIVQGKRPIPRA